MSRGLRLEYSPPPRPLPCGLALGGCYSLWLWPLEVSDFLNMAVLAEAVLSIAKAIGDLLPLAKDMVTILAGSTFWAGSRLRSENIYKGNDEIRKNQEGNNCNQDIHQDPLFEPQTIKAQMNIIA